MAGIEKNQRRPAPGFAQPGRQVDGVERLAPLEDQAPSFRVSPRSHAVTREVEDVEAARCQSFGDRIGADASSGRNHAPLLSAGINVPDLLGDALSKLLGRNVPADVAQAVLMRFNERTTFERRSNLYLPVFKNNREWAEYFIYSGEVPPDEDEEQLTGRERMASEVDAVMAELTS